MKEDYDFNEVLKHLFGKSFEELMDDSTEITQDDADEINELLKGVTVEDNELE